MEILKSQKGNLEKLENLVFWFKQGVSAEIIRVYLEQFFWAIIVYRFD